MLCTGLAILGLCFPLPGHTRAETEAAGWLYRTEDDSHWWATRWYAAGSYRVLAGVSGKNARVETLLVLEPRSDHPRLGPLLDSLCSKSANSIRSCRIAGRKLTAMSCFGGWVIASNGMSADEGLQLRELYEKLSPLFEEVLNEKKGVHPGTPTP